MTVQVALDGRSLSWTAASSPVGSVTLVALSLRLATHLAEEGVR